MLRFSWREPVGSQVANLVTDDGDVLLADDGETALTVILPPVYVTAWREPPPERWRQP
jgi:hypothetical protein